MAQLFRVISMLLLVTCVANVADASHLALRGQCSSSILSCGGIDEARADSSANSGLDSKLLDAPAMSFVAAASSNDRSEGSSKAPVSDHQCHLGHCGCFTTATSSTFAIRFSATEVTPVLASDPCTQSPRSIDRPPRA